MRVRDLQVESIKTLNTRYDPSRNQLAAKNGVMGQATVQKTCWGYLFRRSLHLDGFLIASITTLLVVVGTIGQSHEESGPFGIHNPKIFPKPIPAAFSGPPPGCDSLADVQAAGAKWVRHAGFEGLPWDFIETAKGRYDWKQRDYVYGETHRLGIKMIVSVMCFNRWDQKVRRPNGKIPHDMNAYLRFLGMAVERYDGDGEEDAPGSPVVDVWQIENEVDLRHFWTDTPANYARLLAESYATIKAANPKAKVMIAGVCNPAGFYRYYMKVLQELRKHKKRCFDIFDFHWSGQFPKSNYRQIPLAGKIYEMASYVNDIQEQMEKLGTQYRCIPLWITEMSDYDGSPQVPERGPLPPFPFRSETYQSQQVVKRYIYPLAHGVDKIFWITLTEWHNYGGNEIGGGYFDHVGLINNPKGKDGARHKKLAYYTYKKLSELLPDATAGTVSVIEDKSDIHVYKHSGRNGVVWIAWNDNPQPKEVTIALGNDIKSIKITQAVPKYDSGKDVRNYGDAFTSQIAKVRQGNITVELNSCPVLLFSGSQAMTGKQ